LAVIGEGWVPREELLLGDVVVDLYDLGAGISLMFYPLALASSPFRHIPRNLGMTYVLGLVKILAA
jgi:hypothetical protein